MRNEKAGLEVADDPIVEVFSLFSFILSWTFQVDLTPISGSSLVRNLQVFVKQYVKKKEKGKERERERSRQVG